MWAVIELTQKHSTIEKKHLVWKLKDTSIVERWVNLINVCNANGPQVRYTSWGMYDDKSKIKDVITSMNQSILLFNENNGDGFTIEQCPHEDTNQSQLNKIHAQFEHYANIYQLGNENEQQGSGSGMKKEPKWDKNLLAQHLGNINECVHTCEKLLEINNEYCVGSFSFYLLNSAGLAIEEPLEDADYEQFTLGYEFGDLLLGYATLGKNLFHIYKNDDLELLKAGARAAPQKVISTNTMGMFYEGTTDVNERTPYLEWFDKENISQYGYSKENIKNGIGYIPLGNLLRNSATKLLSKREFIQHYTDYSTIKKIIIFDHDPIEYHA